MFKRVILLVGFLVSFSTSFAQEHQATATAATTTSVSTEASAADQEATENKEYIRHHLLDGHSFNLMTLKDGSHIGIPLPVLFYDNGFHAMMSSKFDHDAVVESNGGYYKLYHEKIYKTDAAGTINVEHGHATNDKVIDFSMTKSVLVLLITALLMIWIFGSMARSYKTSALPKGIGRIMEPIIIFVRDEIAIPNIGVKYKKYMGFLLSIFFFILFLNLFGLTPLGINVTGNISITFGLAFFTFIVTQFTANKAYWQHIFWMPGLPFLMKIVMMPIEVLGVFIKPFALLIRLFANMSAGHIVVMSLIAMIYFFKNVIAGVAFPSLVFVLYLLEILVAVLQAYIFTMLSAVYFGMANEEHGHEGEEGGFIEANH